MTRLKIVASNATIDDVGMDSSLVDKPDQRRTVRTHLPCLVWLESADADVSFEEGVARALDLSSRGVGVLRSKSGEVGVRVRVELLIPPANLRLQTTGTTMNAQELEDGWRLGIQFDAPPVLVDAPNGQPYRPSDSAASEGPDESQE